MKKLVTLVLSVCMLLCVFAPFAGCTPQKSNNIDADDIPEGVVISSNGKEVYCESKEGKERLKITYNLSGYGSEWLQVIAANFVKENPEYWLFLDGDAAIANSMSTLLEAGMNLSDIYMPLNSPWTIYTSYGWLEEISDVYDSVPEGETKTVFEKMDPLWQDFCTTEYKGVEGKYAMPWTEAVSGFAYNKTMFDRYGWQVPETMPEMIALCDKILADTNGKIAPFVFPGTTGGYYGYNVASWWLQSSGLEGVKEFYDFGSVDVYDPSKQPRKGLADALDAFMSLFGYEHLNYSLRGSMSKNHIEAQLAFLRGEAAMIPNASWLECEMKEDIPEGFELRMMRTPYLENAQKDENGNYKRVTYGTMPDYMFIPAKATNKTAAKKFLVYQASEKMLRLFLKYAGTVRPFEFDVMSVYDEMSPFVKDCIDIWYGADSFFECSPSKLYKKGYTGTYLTKIPFPALTYGPDDGGTTVSRYMKEEFVYAQEHWAGWVSSI